MIGEFYFDLSSFTSILTLLLVVVSIIYFYFEIKKINNHISFLEECYNSLNINFKNNDINNGINNKNNILDTVTVDDTNSEDNLKTDELKKDIIIDIDDKGTINNEWGEINNLMNNQETFKNQDVHELTKEDVQESFKNQDVHELTKEDVHESFKNQDILGLPPNEDINNDIDDILNSFDNDNDLSIKTIETVNYESMTVSELKKILTDNELPVSGNKTKLISRIKEHRSIEM